MPEVGASSRITPAWFCKSYLADWACAMVFMLMGEVFNYFVPTYDFALPPTIDGQLGLPLIPGVFKTNNI
jgi:hypothetical protein